MIIKTGASQAVIDFLKKEPVINLNMLGIIENLPEAPIYIDDIDNPQGVFIKKDYMSYIYSNSDSFIDEVCDTFFKDNFYGFSGVEESIAQKIKARYAVNWENPCTIYYLPKENLDMSRIKCPAEAIRPEDAETVNRFYQYSHSGSLEVIRNDIKRRPSSAVYVDGDIACWVLIHDDNSMGIMYTKEEYRRRGYAVDVTVDLASKIIDSGKIPYLQIVDGNGMSPGLAKKCGFVECGRATWFGIIAGVPGELVEINNSSRKQFMDGIGGKAGSVISAGDEALSCMYRVLYKLDDSLERMQGFSLSRVDNERMLDTWCHVVCSSYVIPESDAENFKRAIKDLAGDEKIISYIGLLDGSPVSASALLKLKDDVYGLYLLSVLPGMRLRGIGTATAACILRDGEKNGCEVVVLQAPCRYQGLFSKLGFNTTHEIKAGK